MQAPRFPPPATILLLLLALAMPWIVGGPYYMQVLNLALIYAILTLGLNFTLGWTGMISIGHAAFFGIGAYTSALLTVRLHWNFWPALLASILVNAVVAALFGWPILHLKTHYFALATLGFGEIVRLLLLNWKSLTRGTDGILRIPLMWTFGWAPRNEVQKYYFLLTFVIVAVLVTWRIQQSKFGRAFVALRDSELATEAMGINTAGLKILAFVLSAVFAGVAGSLYAHVFTFISPDSFGFSVTITVLTALLIGGAGTVSGPVLGGVLLTFLPEWLRFLKDYYMLFYGIGMVLLIVLLPKGAVGALRDWRYRHWEGPFSRGKKWSWKLHRTAACGEDVAEGETSG